MIRLLDRGRDQSLIRFTPRDKYRIRTEEYELQYGYHCPFCNNVIQALFFTNDPVNVELFEETRVLSQGEKNEGELLKNVPNDVDGGNYKVDFYRTPKGNAQRITLKNHVVNWKGADGNRENFFEPGERCCMFTAILPTREENLMNEFLTVFGGDVTWLQGIRQDKSTPDFEFFKKWFDEVSSFITRDSRWINGVGSAPIGVMLRRKSIKEPDYGMTSRFYAAWDLEVQRRDELAKALAPENKAA